jgi:hypothetical protein
MRRLVSIATAAAAIVLTAACGTGEPAGSLPARDAAPVPPARATLVAAPAAPDLVGSDAAPPVGTEAPATFLAVRDQTRLVVADTATGEDQRVLFDLGPQDQQVPEYQRPRISGVALSPDRATAFFGAGSPGEPGVLYRVAVDGGPAKKIGPGSWPSVSPDGGRLAFIDDETVVVQNLATAAVRRLELPANDDGHVYLPRAVEWAADSRHLVLETQWLHSFTVLDADTATHQLDGRKIGNAPASAEYWMSGGRAVDGSVGALISLWKPETDVGLAARTFVVLDPATGAERDRVELSFGAEDSTYDVSGRHLLLIAEDGSVHRSQGDGFIKIPGAGANLVAW